MASSSSGPGNEEQLKLFREVVSKENANLDVLVTEKTTQLAEYRALRTRLEDLPKKLQHDIMVPFGKVGFMPGKIVRTNEVMMLVGDDYFVERSCFEANECIDRRIEVIEKSLENFEASRKRLAEDLNYAERLFGQGEGIEIVEELDEEKEEQLRQKRRDQLSKASAMKSAATNVSQNELDIMKHLEELELIEQENGELDEDEDTPPKIVCPPGISEKDFHRLLCRLDEEDSSEEDEEESCGGDDSDLDSDDLAESQDIEDGKDPIVEAKVERKRSVRFSEELETLTTIRADDPVSVIMPANGYTEATGSILRNRDMKSPCDAEALEAMKKADSQPRVIAGSQTAFNGIVVERQIDAPESSTTFDEIQPPKRVSKFKMQRSQQ